MPTRDAVIVGSGPNGLAAGIVLAQAGWGVTVCEAADTAGGGMRTAELTEPGFRHDVCSAVHPTGVSSPFFTTLGLEKYGLAYIQPELPVAHPLDDGTAYLARSIDETAEALGRDATTWRKLMQPLVDDWDSLLPAVMGPLRLTAGPMLMARFGLRALKSTFGLSRRFRTPQARALVAGLAAHSMIPLEKTPSAAFALVLAVAGHAAGWPVAKGGSQRIADALVACLERHGGEVRTGHAVASFDDLPAGSVALFDVTPRQLVRIAGEHLPRSYVRKLLRFRYGMGVFKVDYALSEPVPWKAEACRRAGTVHVGGTLEEIAASERDAWNGRVSERPYVLVAQQSVCDDTRAPAGKHTLWAYCHVPHGRDADMTEAIDNQIERFAPGFRDTVIARHTRGPLEMERYNPNYVGGDIGGGVTDVKGLFMRPTFGPDPYATPNPRIFICSSSTPPGGGVHGMCGYHAAQSVLRRRTPALRGQPTQRTRTALRTRTDIGIVVE